MSDETMPHGGVFPDEQGEATGSTSIPVLEERIEVGRKVVDTGGRLRVTKRLDVRRVPVDATRRRSEFVIERVPVDRPIDRRLDIRQEGDTTVVPVIEERVVAVKRLFLVEEIRLTRRTLETRVHAEVDAFAERATVERRDRADARWRPADPEPGRDHESRRPAPTGAPATRARAGGSRARLASPRSRATMHTLVAMFEDTAAAQAAIDRLTAAGVPRSDITLNGTAGIEGNIEPVSSEAREHEHAGGIRGFFERLFGSDEDDYDSRTYGEAVGRGHAMVAVEVDNEARMSAVADMLNECGALDVDERAAQWRDHGVGRDAGFGEPTLARAGEPAIDASARGPAAGSDERQAVLPVIEEQLRVGKRAVQRGGVRVYQRVVETPVDESVQLREEHARVERQPVDRPATEADIAAMNERSIELRETAEEPVIAKSARVVEEVRVGKDVGQRTEKVHDTVRRTQVEVEELGEHAMARDRPRDDIAAAADRGREPLGERPGSRDPSMAPGAADSSIDRPGLNSDQIRGRERQAAGEARDAAGDATDRTGERMRGKLQKAGGKIQEGYGNLKQDLDPDRR